jgi:hypothetical protein
MPLSPSPAVGRACDVLEELARNPDEPLTISEIARGFGVAGVGRAWAREAR